MTPPPRPDWSNTPPNERRDPPRFRWHRHDGEKRSAGPIAMALLLLGSLLSLLGLSQK